MSSRFDALCRCLLGAHLVLLWLGSCPDVLAQTSEAPASRAGVLRVAADPNNLPFTNARLEGFENKIAELIAKELNLELQYTWRAQRRGFFRETLKEGNVDLVLGAPAKFERALTTAPYYRSSYVLVSRKDRNLEISSFDDPALRSLKIGVQLIGDDGINTPPCGALAQRGIITNIAGFTVYGDYTQENPASEVVQAVADRRVDVAIVWGPLAGYFAARNPDLKTEMPEMKGAAKDPPMAFDICFAVSRKNTALKESLDRVIAEKQVEIDRILDSYNIPRVAATTSGEPQE